MASSMVREILWRLESFATLIAYCMFFSVVIQFRLVQEDLFTNFTISGREDFNMKLLEMAVQLL